MRYKKVEDDPIYLSMLNYIYQRGEVHPSELSRVYDISRQAVDYRLGILEERGLIVRKYGEGGKVYFSLSNDGVELLKSKYEELEVGDVGKRLLSRPSFFYTKLLVSIVFLVVGIIGFIYYFIVYKDVYRGIMALLGWIIIDGIYIFLVFLRD